MTDKLMHIPNDDTEKYPFCRFQMDTQLIDQPIKVSSVDKPKNKKTLRTNVINNPMSPPSLIAIRLWLCSIKRVKQKGRDILCCCNNMQCL